MRHQRRQERDVGDDAANVGLLQPAVEPLDRGLAGRRPRDHLGQHGVVVGRHGIAIAITGIDPQAVDGIGRAPGPDPADRRHEILLRVFRIDPRLDGVAVQLDLVLRQRQLFAERHPQLPLHQVDAGDQFGHGMLDLQAGVHLDEEHFLAVGDEFDGAGADIVHRGGGLARGGADGLALRGIERRRRRFLDHLLVPPLQRAFALEERQQIAMAVADDLHLDVARVLRRYFSISMRSSPNAALASRLALTIAAASSPAELHHAHAAPAAAGGCLHQHRKTDPVGGLCQRRLVLGLAVIAGHQRHVGFFHQLLRAGLRAHRRHHLGGRTDEHQPRIRQACANSAFSDRKP